MKNGDIVKLSDDDHNGVHIRHDMRGRIGFIVDIERKKTKELIEHGILSDGEKLFIIFLFDTQTNHYISSRFLKEFIRSKK